MDIEALSKLSARARFNRLGAVKYVLVATLVLLSIASVELLRARQENGCIVSVAVVGLAKGFHLQDEYESAHPGEKYPGSKQQQADDANTMQLLRPQLDACRTELDSLPEWVLEWLKIAGLNPIGVAVAQTASAATVSPIAQVQTRSQTEPLGDARLLITMSIFACTVVFFFMSAAALFFSSDPKIIGFAIDSMKTLLGFFCGIITAFMGH